MASKPFKHQGKTGTQGIRSHPHQTDMPPGPDPRLATPSPSGRHADMPTSLQLLATALLSRAALLLFLSSSSCLISSPLLISSSLFRIAATCAWIWLKELRCVNLGVSGVDACCQRLPLSIPTRTEGTVNTEPPVSSAPVFVSIPFMGFTGAHQVPANDPTGDHQVPETWRVPSSGRTSEAIRPIGAHTGEPSNTDVSRPCRHTPLADNTGFTGVRSNGSDGRFLEGPLRKDRL